MTSEEQHLEGNAAGDVLGQVFAVEMTTAEVICAHCDAIGPISAALVYVMAMGMIIRCPGCCGEALMRIAHGPQCTHLDQIAITQTDTHICEECIKTGDRWIHLRMCLICGHVGCCDSSKNKHPTRHFQQLGHPLMRSIEPGERWIWCYVEEVVPAELVV